MLEAIQAEAEAEAEAAFDPADNRAAPKGGALPGQSGSGANGGQKDGKALSQPAKIMKRMGEMWKQMDEGARKQYEDMAAADLDRFKAAMATNLAYVAEESRKAEEKEAAAAAKAAERAGLAADRAAAKAASKFVDGEGNEVKRNLSSFLHFSAEMRTEVRIKERR